MGSRVGKKAFEKRYNEVNNTKLPFTFLLSSIKRLGYTYEKTLRCGGLKGAIVDIALKKFSDHDNDSEGEDFVDALEGRPKKKTIHDIFEKCVLDQDQEEPKEEEKVVEKKKIKKTNKVKGEKESFKICFD